MNDKATLPDVVGLPPAAFAKFLELCTAAEDIDFDDRRDREKVVQAYVSACQAKAKGENMREAVADVIGDDW